MTQADLHTDEQIRNRKSTSWVPVYPPLHIVGVRYWETHPQGCAPVRGIDGAVRKEQTE